MTLATEHNARVPHEIRLGKTSIAHMRVRCDAANPALS
jgi:hypothetical protein